MDGTQQFCCQIFLYCEITALWSMGTTGDAVFRVISEFDQIFNSDYTSPGL